MKTFLFHIFNLFFHIELPRAQLFHMLWIILYTNI